MTTRSRSPRADAHRSVGGPAVAFLAVVGLVLPAACDPTHAPSTDASRAPRAVSGSPESPVSAAADAPKVAQVLAPSSRWPTCLTSPTATPCPFGDGAWVESRDGFVGRFAVAEIADAKLRRERDPSRLLDATAALATRVVPGPVLELAPDTKDKDVRVFVAGARVWSPSAQRVALKTSVNGKVTLALNGAVVVDEDGDQYLLPDHRRTLVSLQAGWNTFAVRLERTPDYALRLAMRLRAEDGSPLSGLAWGLPRAEGARDAKAALCAALDARVTATVTSEGWRIDGVIDSEGLLPWPVPRSVQLVAGMGAATATVAEVAFAPDESTRTISATVPDKAVDLAVVVDGARCKDIALRPRPERARVLAAEARIALAPPVLLAAGDRESLDYQALDARRLVQAASLGDRAAERRLPGALTHLEEHLARLDAGRPAFVSPGVHVRAYRSDYDGSLQRYLVVIPESYARGTREPSKDGDGVPLIMTSHGLEYTPEDMLRIAFAKPSGPGESYRNGAIYKWDPPEHPSGAIVVAHDGYGNAGQRIPGEVDVLRVIEEVKAAYRIDPRRVSITGFSLGGSVAFWVPFRSPSLFAAAAPLCGYPNVLDYRTVKAARKRPWEAQLLDEEGVAPYAESGRYLPLKMVHGTMDQPSRSELIHDRYKTLRYASELETPPLGHNVWDHAFEDGDLLRWLAARRRPKAAPQPVVRSGRYRYAEAYWLRIDRFTDESLFGQLEGAFKGDRLEVSTRNVTAFTILGSELGERSSKQQDLIVDGKNLGNIRVGPGAFVSRTSSGWTVSGTSDLPATDKHKGQEGPLSDLWYDRFIVVYGTQVAAEVEANRLTAERFAVHSPWISARVRVLADTEVQDRDLRDQSIVLIGRPATNLVTQAAAAALDQAGIRFEPNALVFGGERFEGSEVGLSTIRPSPFGDDHYLVLHAGVGPEGTLSARYIPDMSPDFLVYDSGMRAVFGDRVLGPRTVLAGGFYDVHWQIPSNVRAVETAPNPERPRGRQRDDQRKTPRSPKPPR
jgi:predicted esterase